MSSERYRVTLHTCCEHQNHHDGVECMVYADDLEIAGGIAASWHGQPLAMFPAPDGLSTHFPGVIEVAQRGCSLFMIQDTHSDRRAES